MKLYSFLIILSLFCKILCLKDSNVVIKSKGVIEKGKNFLGSGILEFNGPIQDISIVDNENKVLQDYPIIKRATSIYNLSDNRLDANPYSITELTQSKHFLLTDEPDGTRMLTFAELNLNSVMNTGLIVSKFKLPTNNCNSVKGFESKHLYFATVLCSNTDSTKSMIYLVAINKTKVFRKDNVALEYNLDEKYDEIQLAMVDDTSFLIVGYIKSQSLLKFLSVNIAYKNGDFEKTEVNQAISIKENNQLPNIDLFWLNSVPRYGFSLIYTKKIIDATTSNAPFVSMFNKN